jgi:hypothetical protein
MRDESLLIRRVPDKYGDGIAVNLTRNQVLEIGLASKPWIVEDLIALLPKPVVKTSKYDRDLLRRALGESA